MPDDLTGAPAPVAGAPVPPPLDQWHQQLTDLLNPPAAMYGRLQMIDNVTLQAAEAALIRALSGSQADTWKTYRWFLLRSNLGNWWRIRGNGISGNVDRMTAEGTAPVAAYCAHPPGWLADPAVYLAQMITLTHDEERFTDVAIRHYTYDQPEPTLGQLTRTFVNNMGEPLEGLITLQEAVPGQPPHRPGRL